jgi:hypothetical protein
MNGARKQALLDRMQAERARLDAALAGIDDAATVRPGFDGEMSVKDLLAHISAWEQLCMGWIRAGQRGNQPDRPDQYTDESVNALNAEIYAENRDRPLGEVRDDFERSWQEFGALVESLDERQLLEKGVWEWTGDRTLEFMISANADWHYREHAEQLERWAAGRT